MMVKLAVPVSGMAFATTVLEQAAGTLGLIAGCVASVGVILVGGRHLWHFGRNIGRVVENTAELPEFVREQRQLNAEQRQLNRAVAERLANVEGQLEAFGTAERAAVSAVIEASNAPRPPRRTDPEPRYGWRE